ncbi:MAG: hypothetical protein R3273_11900 [Pseudidiomarina maritima]|nr:hypothetical protein [Pseudidiomarina maritima]
MAEGKSTWMRDLLLIPVAVGVVIAVVSFLLPKFLSDSREISYQIEEPLAYLDKASLGSAEVRINDSVVQEVFAVRVKTWNSGSVPLKDLAILFEFDSGDQAFQILSATHHTKPAREFGRIEEHGGDESSKRFVYELLNPGDEDSVVFLTTAKADIKVFAKAEKLAVKEVAPEEKGEFKWYMAAFGGMLAALLGELIQSILNKWRQRRKRIVSGRIHDSNK